jgi:lactoylglutathione lyase
MADPGAGPARLDHARLDHVGLAVADLPAAAAWYADVLGLVPELSLRVEALDLSIEMLIHPVHGCTGPARRTRGKPADPAAAALRAGYGHVAFDVTDLDAACQRAIERGGRPVMPPGPSPEAGVRMAFIIDPEGNLIEFLHRP